MYLQVLLCLVFACLPFASAQIHVYVSVAGDNEIAVFHQDSDGALTKHSRSPADTAPGSLATHPTKPVLYAALRGSKQLGAFTMAADGSLSLLNTVPAGSSAYILPDATGGVLVSAYYREGKVRVHRLRADGSIMAEALQVIATDEKTHGVRFSPDQRFVYLPHTGPNAVFQFSFKATTGRLSPLDPFRAEPMPETYPRHLWFHPELPVAYTSNERSSGVSRWAFDAETGQLKATQTLSTLPEDFDPATTRNGRNSTSDVEVHPSGNFVYVANRGHNSLAAFSLDKKGHMRAIGQTPTEDTPRSFNISPDGKFIYAAGQRSGKLACYRVNLSTGALQRFDTLVVGKAPSWVQCVRRP